MRKCYYWRFSKCSKRLQVYTLYMKCRDEKKSSKRSITVAVDYSLAQHETI